MHKKKWFSFFGIFLFSFGFFLLINFYSGITGFVVIEDISREAKGFFGFLFVLTGLGILIFSEVARETKKPYKIKPLEHLLKDAEINHTEYIVLDSSAAIDYQDNISALINRYSGKLYVPRRIRQELINNGRLKHYLTDMNAIRMLDSATPGVDKKDYRGSRGVARRFLAETKKHKHYLKIKPYSEGKTKMSEDFWKDHGKEIEKIKERVQENLEKRSSRKLPENQEKTS